MKSTIEELRAHYLQQENSTTIYEEDCVCTLPIKGNRKKIVFLTDELNRQKFKDLLVKMNVHGASSMDVYCSTATYISDTAHIILNRDDYD